MSMPQPIFIALIGSSKAQVSKAKKHFRLSVPGMGPAPLAALDSQPGDKIVHPSEVPKGLITLWVALDAESLSLSRSLHAADARLPRYDRGFYEELLPEPCVLIPIDDRDAKTRLSALRKKISEAYFETS
ncbi:MAG TPA: hypothetical protein PK867_07325 [Pirellulales bacterium]|nr:hypothetical protein [Pirellulales bacterium]